MQFLQTLKIFQGNKICLVKRDFNLIIDFVSSIKN